MSENDGGTNQRNMYASPVGTMAPSNLQGGGGEDSAAPGIITLIQLATVGVKFLKIF